MPLVSVQQAIARIRTHAIGVGEDHMKPDARDFTKGLIRHGLVEALFLEVHSDDQDFFDELAQDPNNPQLQAALGRMGPDWQHKNSTLLVTVASLAIRAGIPVFFLDVQAGQVDFAAHGVDDMKIEAKHGKINNFSKAGMTIRDAHAAGVFRKIVATRLGGRDAGCLLLYGGEHFLGNVHHRPGVSLADHLNLYYVLFK